MELINKLKITRISDKTEYIEDEIVREYPFTIFINGEEFITLLCSPSALEHLAVGFLNSEGIIESYKDVKSINLNERDGIADIELISPDYRTKLYGRRVLTTGCGKGSIFYSAAQRFNSVKIDSDMKISCSEVLSIVKAVEAKGDIFKKTGGTHGCGLCSEDEVLLFHEDIGRHNALDKVFGQAVVEGIGLEDKIVVTSGRISSEIILKVIKRGIPMVISRSAPTDTAIKLAQETGITVIGFVRGSRVNVYSHEERVIK